jgi:hypothetical protein
MIVIGDLNPELIEQLADSRGVPRIDDSREVDALFDSLRAFKASMARKPSVKRPPKPRPPEPKPPELPKAHAAEPCTWRAAPPGSLQDQLHQLTHVLTGKCVPVLIDNNIESNGQTSRWSDETFEIRLREQYDGDSFLNTALHEIGHIKSHLISGSDSETAANFWRDIWLAKSDSLARQNFHGKSDWQLRLRALIEN